MYAIIKTGGKQYRVEQGDIIEVEKLPGAPGDTINIEEVLLVADGADVKAGRPYIASSKVICEVISHRKDKKVVAFKFRRRKNSKSKKGHRQLLTRLKVKEVIV